MPAQKTHQTNILLNVIFTEQMLAFRMMKKLFNPAEIPDCLKTSGKGDENSLINIFLGISWKAISQIWYLDYDKSQYLSCLKFYLATG